MKETIFTIGHSNHDIGDFISLLEAHGVNCVVDVRSTPLSQRNPQFNREALRESLREREILYMHFGKEFGARRENAAVQTAAGKVDFEKVRRTESFRQGVERLQSGLQQGYAIALMCAESHPLDCHRFSMIAVHLEQAGYDIQHILKDKTLVCHQDMEAEMLKKYQKKLPVPSLFEPEVSPEDCLLAAYRLHNEEIGWQAPEAV